MQASARPLLDAVEELEGELNSSFPENPLTMALLFEQYIS